MNQSWRRRQLRVIGSNLVAYNDVTGKAIATIDLKRALAVEDDQQPLPPNAIPGRKPRDEGDILFMVERSFRLLFSNDEDIAFYADTDEEKAEWLVRFCQVLWSLLIVSLGCVYCELWLGTSLLILYGQNWCGNDMSRRRPLKRNRLSNLRHPHPLLTPLPVRLLQLHHPSQKLGCLYHGPRRIDELWMI